jgi:DNA-binding phage protein
MAKSNGKSSLKLYKSYNFVDKDPVIDRMRTILKKEGQSYKEIHENSGVSVTTMYNWFDGKTRRPQYATVMAVVRALGYRQNFVKGKAP